MFFGVIALLALVGLEPPPRPPFVVAVGPWLGYDPLVLAREQGRLPASIRIVEMPSATDTQSALRDGRLNAAAVTLDEALRLSRRIPDLRVIAVLSESRGADGVVVRAGLDASSGLDGRRVLVEDSAVGGLLLAAALQVEGLSADRVDVVQARAQHLEKRWREGDTDAVVCYEPLLSRLRADGHQLLHSTRELPGLIYDVLVVREPTLGARAADLRSLLTAWEEVAPAFSGVEALPLELLVPGTGLDTAAYQRALAGIRFFDTRESHALLVDVDSELASVLPQLDLLLQSRGELEQSGASLRLLEPGPQTALVEALADAR